MNHYFDEDEPIFRDQPLLSPARIGNFDEGLADHQIDDSSSPSPRDDRQHHRRIDPGNVILVYNLNPNYPELTQTGHSFEFESGSSSDRSPSFTVLMAAPEETAPVDGAAPARAENVPHLETGHPDQIGDSESTLDALSLKESARAAFAVTESELETRSDIKDLASRTRVDSAQEGIPQLLPEPRSSRQNARSPLKLQIQAEPTGQQSVEETITNSPTLRKHVISPPEGSLNTLSRLQPTSPTQESKEQLPSFRQLTGQLNELAEAAATVEQHPAQPQQYSHHQSHSFSSTTSQSPRLPYYAASAQTSPVSYYPQVARSPTGAAGESHHYQSPPMMSAVYYAERRSSAVTDHTISMPPSLPSASSSAESHGHTSSSTDGYSTSHTTPIDQPPTADGTPRPILPPLQGLPQSAMMMSQGFKCDYPGCTAVPFQTQYLLSSHKNVHSQNRPHYCPVKECPRSEGGKGFKRKNEMIRHGLVHNSPGYICPFCPDREHRYPRPDNLQRHVRVHHVDKDRDDPALREVLAQRNEGAGKARRRRTNGTSIGNPN